MNSGFLTLFVLILAVRAVFYHVSFRHTVLSYHIKVLVEIALLFLLFRLDTVPALAIPGLLLVLTLLNAILELRLGREADTQRTAMPLVTPIAFVGLVIVTATLAVTYASPNAPVLRDSAYVIFEVITPQDLLVVSGAFIVFFELGHLYRGKAAASARLLIYVLWWFGSFLAVAVIAAGSVAIEAAVAHGDTRREHANRAGSSVALAVIAGVLARWIVKSFF